MKTFAIILFAFFGLAACSDVLELTPTDAISTEVALETDEGVKQVLIGAYNALSASSLFGGELMRNAELFGGLDEIVWLGTFEAPREIYNHQILVTNVDVEGFWVEAYNLINICNNILAHIDVVKEADRNRVRGEALLLRGWILFELTRFFGQQYVAGTNNTQLGVPIITSPSAASTDNAFPARNTVEECYAQALADVTEAEALLPATNEVFATKYTAAAVLARIYLQMENYEAARDAAHRVISSGKYSLLPTYAEIFNTDGLTKECVFGIVVTATDGINAMNTYFSTLAYGGRGDIEIKQSFLDLYDPADTRKALYFKTANRWRTGKFNNQFGDINIIRLAEMYLIRAECNLRLGTAVGASPVDDYNKTRVRAGLPAVTTVTLDDILLERRLELAHEGLRVHDIKRLRQSVGSFAWNDPMMVYPIPQREITINPNLIQNPGY
ncbi:MAG: RagB/SusD family nutrient uptake outer membrane protein [Chitinophagales bacterium]|nr:RagB/SusD family nutrient uptake outer membrane protein [Chitinophagales bacterium]MDW8427031.1 RagB/SusD family nutrient uptake outer membrane protein [Chitinophagales bacterium]